MTEHDFLQRFLFEKHPIRGELVRLDNSWQEILKRKQYPNVIQRLVGEMLVSSVLLSSILKFEGSLTVQIQGSGPISLAVAEASSERTIRGLAQWQGEVSDGASLKELVGNGTLVITIEPKQAERYQGIVELLPEGFSQSVDHYMKRSQQLETCLILAVSEKSAAGILLQKMPNMTSAVEDTLESGDEAWRRVKMLAYTLRGEELLGLDFADIIHRLFHEDDVRVFNGETVSFNCSCSREKVTSTLKMLGEEEVQSVLAEFSKVSVNCQFCNHLYEFDKVDVEVIFKGDPECGISPTKH